MNRTIRDQLYLRFFRIYRSYLGLRFKIAKTKNELEQANEFMVSIFEQSGFYHPEFQPRRISDSTGEESLGIASYKKEIIGVIDVAAGQKEFMVENFFNVDFPEDVIREDVVEISRFAIDPNFRKNNATVAILLLLHALEFTRKRGAQYWIGCSSGWLMQGFRPYFGNWRILEQKSLTEKQIDFRTGRDGFFDQKMDVQVYVLDAHSISISRIADSIFRRYFRKRKWRRLAKVQG